METLVLLFIIFSIVSSVIESVRKSRRPPGTFTAQPMEEPDWEESDKEELSDPSRSSPPPAVVRPPVRQAPMVARQGSPSAPTVSPEEIIRRLLMGDEPGGAMPARPAPPRVAQAPQAASPSDAGEARKVDFSRIAESRDLRRQASEREQTRREGRTQAAQAVKVRAQQAEDRFRERALQLKQAQDQRLMAVRRVFQSATLGGSTAAKTKGSAAPAPFDAYAQGVAESIGSAPLTADKLREAMLLHEILQPPLSLRGARAIRTR